MIDERKMEIRRLVAADLSAVAALEGLCFAEPWSESALQLLLGETAIGYAAIVNGCVVGYVGMLLAPGEGQITNLAVHPDYRRCGIARRILDALIDSAIARELEDIALEVRVGNTAAIGLYESSGFTVAGRRKHFYKNPTEDAFVMLRSISGKS